MKFKVARAGIHMWEEPVISGDKGSGTIFFSGCALKCVYCQNYEISHGAKGLFIDGGELSFLMLYLQDLGAHNINLVTPSHYAGHIAEVLAKIKGSLLKIPVVYNTSGYEKISALKLLEGLVDIYLPDFKYADNALGQKYSKVPDYTDIAVAAIAEMRRQQPVDIIDNGIMQKGVIVRHLALPSHKEDSKKVLDILSRLDSTLCVSLMCQYFPTPGVSAFPELQKRIRKSDYNDLLEYFQNVGLSRGFSQCPSSATEDYVPDFDLAELSKILSKKSALPIY
ncbi:MAG: radical SAM protein [Clostridia bacterium]|nr:radical SAM protein [Clostridia bacterium]